MEYVYTKRLEIFNTDYLKNCFNFYSSCIEVEKNECTCQMTLFTGDEEKGGLYITTSMSMIDVKSREIESEIS